MLDPKRLKELGLCSADSHVPRLNTDYAEYAIGGKGISFFMPQAVCQCGQCYLSAEGLWVPKREITALMVIEDDTALIFEMDTTALAA